MDGPHSLANDALKHRSVRGVPFEGDDGWHRHVLSMNSTSSLAVHQNGLSARQPEWFGGLGRLETGRPG